MKEHRISILAVFIAVIIMLVVSVLPHHHHADGRLCLHPTTETKAPASHGNAQCGSDCVARFSQVQRQHVHTYQCSHVLAAILAPVQLFTEAVSMSSLSAVLPQLVYVEQLHGVFLTHTSGMRAPPVSIA